MRHVDGGRRVLGRLDGHEPIRLPAGGVALPQREFRHRHADVFAGEEFQAERIAGRKVDRSKRNGRSVAVGVRPGRRQIDRLQVGERLLLGGSVFGGCGGGVFTTALGGGVCTGGDGGAAGFGGSDGFVSPFSFTDALVFVPLSCLSFSGPIWMSG